MMNINITIIQIPGTKSQEQSAIMSLIKKGFPGCAETEYVWSRVGNFLNYQRFLCENPTPKIVYKV